MVGIFTCSFHTWWEPDGRVERIHSRGRHSQSGQAWHSTATDLCVMVMMKTVNGTHTSAHIHRVRITLGQVGHDVGRVVNFCE